MLIASDSEPVRDGLRSLISLTRDWELCGEARVGRDAYELALEKQPDVVIVDMVAPAMGISLARLLRDDLPAAQCLLLTIHDAADTVKSAIAAGVKGYVLKRGGDSDILAAIRRLDAGHSYYSPVVLDVIADSASGERRTDPAAFTARELSVISLVAHGCANRNMAELLGISVRTVEAHRAAAMRKVGVRSGAALVAFALQHKLIA